MVFPQSMSSFVPKKYMSMKVFTYKGIQLVSVMCEYVSFRLSRNGNSELMMLQDDVWSSKVCIIEVQIRQGSFDDVFTMISGCISSYMLPKHSYVNVFLTLWWHWGLSLCFSLYMRLLGLFWCSCCVML